MPRPLLRLAHGDCEALVYAGRGADGAPRLLIRLRCPGIDGLLVSPPTPSPWCRMVHGGDLRRLLGMAYKLLDLGRGACLLVQPPWLRGVDPLEAAVEAGIVECVDCLGEDEVKRLLGYVKWRAEELAGRH